MVLEFLKRDPEKTVPDGPSIDPARSANGKEPGLGTGVTGVMSTLPPPPNGGLVAWLQVLAAFFGNFNSWGIINAFGVYQEYYETDLLSDRTPFQISWIISLAGALLLFGSNCFGGFVDLGYMKVMCLGASLLQFAALMLLSWSKTYAEVILTQGLFAGLMSGLLFILTITAVSPYFSTRRPIAIGLGAAGSSIGGTVYSCMARRLITTVGFGWSTRIIAFVELGTTGIMFLCLRRRLPPATRKSFVALECFTELPFMLYSVGNTLNFIGLYTFYVYYESYATEIDPNRNAYLYMTAIINAGSTVGRVIPSLLAVKVGAINLLPFADLFSMILLFCWIPDRSAGGIITLGVLFGIISGPIIAFPGIITSALTKDFNRLGIRLGFLFTFSSFGFVLGPPIAGMIQREYGWFWVKLYSALAMLMSFFCHLALRVSVAGVRIEYA